jgi:1,4-alpha-glucan branching enzyme
MISRLLNKPELLTADPYLNEYQPLLQQRKVLAKAMEKRLLSGHSSLADFAAGYEFFGLHYNSGSDSWRFA